MLDAFYFFFSRPYLRQDNKRWDQNQNRTTNHIQHTERKTITLAWTCSAYGPSAHTTVSTVLAGRLPEYKRGPGLPRANWRSTVNKNLQKMGFTWEEAEVAALDRHGWRRSLAQCVQLDAGWTKDQVLKCHSSYWHGCRPSVCPSVGLSSVTDVLWLNVRS